MPTTDTLPADTVPAFRPVPRRGDAAPAVLLPVVQQHAEEAAHLRHVRSVLVRAPHVGLLQLGRLDERIAAHLDGLLVAGDAGLACARQALDNAGAGEVFALGVLALQTRQHSLIDALLALAATLPAAQRGLASALGWVSATELHGVVRRLLDHPAPHARALGLHACRAHRVDPGPVLATALASAEPAVRCAALQAAAALGRQDLLPAVRPVLTDAEPDLVFHAARAACLLGERQQSPQMLAVAARQADSWSPQALALALAALPMDEAAALGRSLSAAAQAAPADLAARRRLVRALGLLGDVRFVPWLIDRMAEPALARLAGEAFCWITGADLSQPPLQQLQAPGDAPPAGPSESPDDDDVALDEDDSLPWPDAAQVQAWWTRHGPALGAGGAATRLFMGQPAGGPVTRQVLAEGTQRLRAPAAMLLCLRQPGRTLFPVAAPTPRQRRWLASEPA